MRLRYLHAYFRIHACRDAFIRFICFFALFLYGLLKFFDEDRENSETYKFLLTLFSNDTLHSIMHAMLVISQQFDLVRLVTRIFDFPTNLHNLVNNFTSKEKVRKILKLTKFNVYFRI